MEITVKDLVRLDVAHQRLHIERNFNVRRSAAEPNTFRFSMPTEADIGAITHKYSAEPQAHQKLVEVTLASPEAVEENVRFSFSTPVERVGSDWLLRGRSGLIRTSSYELELDLGQAIDASGWHPGDFLGAGHPEYQSGRIMLTANDLGAVFVVDFAVRFRFEEPTYSTEEIDSLLGKMPALEAQSKRAKVFGSFRTLVLLHILTDILPFMRSLERRGLDPAKTLVAFKDYPYFNKQMVEATLKKHGYRMHGPIESKDDPKLFAAVSEFLSLGNEPVIIIEDGGYLIPAFHERLELLPHRTKLRGAVEQTTHGAREAEALLDRLRERGEEARLACPLISVARSEAKTLYEPVFVAEAACKNIAEMTQLSWINAGVLLVGYGSIGSAIGARLKAFGAQVAVCEQSHLRLLTAEAAAAFFISDSVSAAIAEFKRRKRRIQFVIGTTGHTSVGVAEALQLSDFSPILVSVSSQRVEFDISGFEAAAKKIQPYTSQGVEAGLEYFFDGGSVKVLGHGWPINFVRSDSVQNDRIDPIMALLHASAAEIASPDVLLKKGGFPGEGDAKYPGIPKSRLSHEIVGVITEETNLFGPVLASRDLVTEI